jgi:hypothetical protein
MKFLSATLLSVLLCGFCYALLAYVVNPEGDFKTAYFPRMTLPDRETKLRLFERFSQSAPPTGLVLGSSRSMKLKPSDLEKLFGGRFFNFAVTGAAVEDYCAIYYWVRQLGVAPRQLVIGLDVEALDSEEQYSGTAMLNVPELRAAFEGNSNVLRSAADRPAREGHLQLQIFHRDLAFNCAEVEARPSRVGFRHRRVRTLGAL